MIVKLLWYRPQSEKEKAIQSVKEVKKIEEMEIEKNTGSRTKWEADNGSESVKD
jgi:hypothetical protein